MKKARLDGGSATSFGVGIGIGIDFLASTVLSFKTGFDSDSDTEGRRRIQ